MRILSCRASRCSRRPSAAPALASEAAEPFVASRDSAALRPLAPMPHPGGLLRGAQRIRRRPARGRAGGAEPRAPPGLSEQRLRRRLPGLGAQHRLPVHLHLRRIDGRGRSSPMPGSAPGGSPRRRCAAASIARSASPPIITPPRSAPIGRRAWCRRRVVGAHIFYRRPGSGTVEAFSQAPVRGRARARRRRAMRAARTRAAARRARDAAHATSMPVVEIPVVERPVRLPHDRRAPAAAAPRASRAAPPAPPRSAAARGSRSRTASASFAGRDRGSLSCAAPAAGS